jgi:flagellar biosynthesis/type III secretory pathway chaperone
MPDNGHDRLDRIEVDLERLKERHEALTRTVEIIAGMQHKNETLMAQAIEAINGLARIAESHQRRPDGLEEGR